MKFRICYGEALTKHRLNINTHDEYVDERYGCFQYTRDTVLTVLSYTNMG